MENKLNIKVLGTGEIGYKVLVSLIGKIENNTGIYFTDSNGECVEQLSKYKEIIKLHNCEQEITNAIKDAEIFFIIVAADDIKNVRIMLNVAKSIRRLGITTIALVNMPSAYETDKFFIAEENFKDIQSSVDAYTPLYNDKLAELATLEQLKDKDKIKKFILALNIVAFKEGIIALSKAAKIFEIPELKISKEDVKTVLKNKGYCFIGFGNGDSDNRVLQAVRYAVQSPIYERTLEKAKNIIVYIRAKDLSENDLELIKVYFSSVADREVKIYFSAERDVQCGNKLYLTVLATWGD